MSLAVIFSNMTISIFVVVVVFIFQKSLLLLLSVRRYHYFFFVQHYRSCFFLIFFIVIKILFWMYVSPLLSHNSLFFYLLIFFLFLICTELFMFHTSWVFKQHCHCCFYYLITPRSALTYFSRSYSRCKNYTHCVRRLKQLKKLNSNNFFLIIYVYFFRILVKLQKFTFLRSFVRIYDEREIHQNHPPNFQFLFIPHQQCAARHSTTIPTPYIQRVNASLSRVCLYYFSRQVSRMYVCCLWNSHHFFLYFFFYLRVV